MEVSFVGEEVPRGNAAQGIVAFELFDEQLDSRPVVVEAPEVERLQRQIGDQNLVVILAELEECQLGGGLLGLASPDHDEASVPRFEPLDQLVIVKPFVGAVRSRNRRSVVGFG